jgi:hypothetical protein
MRSKFKKALLANFDLMIALAANKLANFDPMIVLATNKSIMRSKLKKSIISTF